VRLHHDGSATVRFTQSIKGRHTWIVFVSRSLRAHVVRDFGAQLVELIE
jgi:hypothetical protein